MIKIDKNIPLPNRRQFPFRDMEVNDSFFVLCIESEKHTIRSIVFSSGRRNKRKYATISEGNGLRVWRIK